MTLWDTIGNFFYELSLSWLTLPRMFCIAAVVIGYFFGMFQSAFLIAKTMRVDIYSQGSGNAGTTNMLRVLGPVPGILTFLFDIGKAVAAVFLVQALLLNWLQIPLDPIVVKLYTGLGVILGHNFPAYLQFRGGKGVAVTCTLFVLLGEWKYIVTGLIVFGVIFLTTRFVSLASMSVAVILAIEFIISTSEGWTYVSPAYRLDCQILVALYAALTIVMHNQNIARLIQGKEKRFSIHKSKETEETEPMEENTENNTAEKNNSENEETR